MTRILIADDHPLFRRALTQAVRDLLPDAHCAEAESLADTQHALEAHPDTDLVLLDLHMPGSHGLMGLAAIRAQFPTVAVAMISAHDNPPTVRRALAYGAAGYISKSADLDEWKTAIKSVLDCEEWIPPTLRADVERTQTASADREFASRLSALTPQQFRVLTMVAEGRLNKQIADALGVQERTVKAHLSAIFERLGVRNRTQAGVLLRSLEVVDPAKVPLVG
jgi:DNA-binding NarL/FixJ family response regulator